LDAGHYAKHKFDGLRGPGVIIFKLPIVREKAILTPRLHPVLQSSREPDSARRAGAVDPARLNLIWIEEKMNDGERAALQIETDHPGPMLSARASANAGPMLPQSADERDAAIRGLLTKRGEARRRRAALATELRTAGQSLYDLGGALKHASRSSMGSRVDRILPKLAKVPAVCDLERLKSMLEELKEVETRLAQLNRSASELGID
jgi:hypothetical protein